MISPQMIQLGLKSLVSQASGVVGNVKHAVKDARSDDGKINFKEGLKIYGEGMKGSIGGGLKALTGMDLGLLVDPEKEALEKQKAQQQEATRLAEQQNESMQEYQTDVDLAAQSLSSPATMKSLSAVGMSYTPLKMKAKEADRAATMMKISGANDMPERSSLTYKKY